MMLRRALRAALLYVAAWSPLVVVFIFILSNQGLDSAEQAVTVAIGTVGLAALLGVPVVAIATRWGWPSRVTFGFVLSHLALAAAYAGLWDVGIVLSMVPSSGSVGQALADARSWIFFQTFEGMMVYCTVAGVTWSRRSMTRAREQGERAARAEALRVQAELAALRGQLDPHFLFNTLHSVAVLVRHDPKLAETALERLASLLRYVLDHKNGLREHVTLSDELAFVDDYLALEGIRFGERLRVERDLAADALECSVPSFALQPLVENAIKHAIAPRAQGGTLWLHGHREGDLLVLEVRDDGPGMAEGASHRREPAQVADGSERRSFGIGLDALRQRLHALYDGAASLSVRSAPGAGFAVSMRLPA